MFMTKRMYAMTNHRTEGCASNIARISVVPDRGTPPKIIKLNNGYKFF